VFGNEIVGHKIAPTYDPFSQLGIPTTPKNNIIGINLCKNLIELVSLCLIMGWRVD